MLIWTGQLEIALCRCGHLLISLEKQNRKKHLKFEGILLIETIVLYELALPMMLFDDILNTVY